MGVPKGLTSTPDIPDPWVRDVADIGFFLVGLVCELCAAWWSRQTAVSVAGFLGSAVENLASPQSRGVYGTDGICGNLVLPTGDGQVG